jgi:hypothetical protein
MLDRNQHQHENHDSRRGRQGRRGQRGGNIGNVAINLSDPGSQFSELSISDLQLNAKSSANSAGELQATPEGVEPEVCFICASPVVHYAVAPCNHRTCHICTLRMRALYKTKDCAHCRVSCSSKPLNCRDSNTRFRQSHNMLSSRMKQINDMRILSQQILSAQMRTLESNMRRRKLWKIHCYSCDTIAQICVVMLRAWGGQTYIAT